jgi:hypothetical protein
MKEMKMLKIVTTPAQALANIIKFEQELQHSPDLQERLAYARAWYACQNKTGKWHFGPSKFVGYEGIDAKTYLRNAEKEADGRRTEAQLQMYFYAIDPTTPLHEELSSALVALLAKYGKSPSTKIRINVIRQRRRLTSPEAPTTDDTQNAVVNLMVAVAKTLPTTQFNHLLKQLEDMA